MGAESGVDGARRSVDHSNTTVVSADSTSDTATTSNNSDGTWKWQITLGNTFLRPVYSLVDCTFLLSLIIIVDPMLD